MLRLLLIGSGVSFRDEITSLDEVYILLIFENGLINDRRTEEMFN